MKNVNVIITTEQSNHNEWMAFACWYSINRNSPTSKVAVIFPRAYKTQLFVWLNKCHVPYLTYGYDITEERAISILIENKIISQPILVIKDYMMMIKKIDLTIDGIVHAENVEGLIDFRKCDKFDLSEWISKEKRHPFFRTSKLMTENRTTSEQRVFQLWQKMGETFDFINRPMV